MNDSILQKVLHEICETFPCKIDTATAFVWLHYRCSNGESCGIKKINDYFELSNLPKYNITYLRRDLIKSKNVLSDGKTGAYRPTRQYIIKLDAQFLHCFEQSEEVVCKGIVLPEVLYKNTRGYIVSLSRQINASYENNIFDGCAVLMRRLLEVLLIHAYDAVGKIMDIQDSDGYKSLNIIIKDVSQKKPFHLSKEVLKILDKFRELGNMSAHKIQYNAKKQYIDEVIALYRLAIEELLYNAKIKA